MFKFFYSQNVNFDLSQSNTSKKENMWVFGTERKKKFTYTVRKKMRNKDSCLKLSTYKIFFLKIFCSQTMTQITQLILKLPRMTKLEYFEA